VALCVQGFWCRQQCRLTPSQQPGLPRCVAQQAHACSESCRTLGEQTSGGGAHSYLACLAERGARPSQLANSMPLADCAPRPSSDRFGCRPRMATV